MKTIEEFTKFTSKSLDKYEHRPRIIMKDGFSMSVQGSHFNYCNPRMDGLNEYKSMEIGFPSEKEPLIMEYAEDPKEPTRTVYGWTPCKVINTVIKQHGGIDVKKTFK